jgi:hypothetical protein
MIRIICSNEEGALDKAKGLYEAGIPFVFQVS